MSVVLDDLITARSLIDTPEKWRKATIKPDVPLCSGEALTEAIVLHPSPETMARKQLLVEALGFDDVDDLVAFNDARTTTHSDIMALFQRAIDAATPPSNANAQTGAK